MIYHTAQFSMTLNDAIPSVTRFQSHALNICSNGMRYIVSMEY